MVFFVGVKLSQCVFSVDQFLNAMQITRSGLHSTAQVRPAPHREGAEGGVEFTAMMYNPGQ